ncbi:MAG TPA: hypothetical protein VF123_06390 [Candidatus Sulfotelmatobacter sp.]
MSIGPIAFYLLQLIWSGLRAIWPFLLIGIGFAALDWSIKDAVRTGVREGLREIFNEIDISAAVAEGIKNARVARDISYELDE